MLQQNLSFHRRNLHKIPEIGKELEKTCSYVQQHLQGLSCEILTPAKSSIVAYFDVGKKNTTAFRADMDALAITEKNDFDFASTHKGYMHACGHDGHTATLLTFAKRIDEIKDGLPNNIMLIFQPDEEINGGAKPICDTGILEKYNVTKIFAYHVWPFYSTDTILSRPKELMAKTSPVYIDIEGISTHVAKAESGADALYSAALLVSKMYEVEKNEVAPEIFRLLKFGIMNSGTANNAISNYARIEGTLRTFEKQTHDFFVQRINETAKEIEQLTGCKFKIEIGAGYPAVINDEQLFSDVVDYLGEDVIKILEKPDMTGEDFSEYLQKTKGMMFYVGSGKDLVPHFDSFDFDEKSMATAFNLFEKLCFMK